MIAIDNYKIEIHKEKLWINNEWTNCLTKGSKKSTLE